MEVQEFVEYQIDLLRKFEKYYSKIHPSNEDDRRPPEEYNNYLKLFHLYEKNPNWFLTKSNKEK